MKREMSTSPNPPRKNDKEWLHWQKFRTTDPSTISVFLDRGRAEVLFSMICAFELGNKQLWELIRAAFGAFSGNPEILSIALEAFSEWYPSNSDVLVQIERHWRSFEHRSPDFDYVQTLRRICNEFADTPPTMMEAIFDDPLFDVVVYLEWHNAA